MCETTPILPRFYGKTIVSKNKEAVFLFEKNGLLMRDNMLNVYFTLSTIALNASGWFIARSARTLRFNSMLFAFTLPIN